MSTGADCRFYEKTPGKWFYDLQEYPYGANEDYDTKGPFPTFRAAYTHLHRNNANPGGFSTSALPGCKHDLVVKLDFPHVEFGKKVTHGCDRCNEHLESAPAGATVRIEEDEADEEPRKAPRGGGFGFGGLFSNRPRGKMW